MNKEYTAVVKEDSGWWVGWIEEIPGVNCQEKTKDELMKSLREALGEALEFNKIDALQAAEDDYSEERIAI